VHIPFEDKGRYVGTIAWRHKGTFVNVEGRGYWLRGEPIPPALPTPSVSNPFDQSERDLAYLIGRNRE
jgi:hypothetical protein